MTTVAWGRESGLVLCRALKLDPNEVLAIDVHWRPDEMVTVEVTMLANEGVVAEIIRLGETR